MNAITKLEGKTCKYIGIAFSEHEALGKYNDQTSSPLFSVLPRELRDLIWALATAPYEDPNAKFEKTAYYYRPGHTARLRTEVALLLTCRRDNWVKALLDAPELRSTPMLKLELETLDHKADQLPVIVDRIKMIESESRPSHYVGNSLTMTRFELVDKQDTSTWEGPTNIDDRVRHAYDGKATLTYHVVTLTWNQRFTELPHASVPGLRRASVALSPDKDSFAVDKDWGRAEGGLRFWYAAILPRRREPRMTEWTEGMKQHHFMLRFWTQVRWVSRRQAELGEAVRRRQFEELCGAAREREWAARWEAEKSLLKFIGHRVP
ncbi:hypothetical protein LTR01_003312 [Friedmanniomyces endolithicus]|nr:hypothetical protein LTR01_003312 [Friedmanniomyces endolithicus]KAK0828674.1 hypothetical protein LTR73_004984 [Friedmanniomyces endolithicus]